VEQFLNSNLPNGGISAKAAELNEEAIGAFRAQRKDHSIELLRQAIAVDASVPDYYINLAVALHGIGSNKERADLYLKALELSPNDPLALSNLASVLNSERRFSEAEKSARKALTNSNNALLDARLNLASSLAGQGRWSEAAHEFDHVLQQMPDNLSVLVSAAKAFRAAGQLKTARHRLCEALALLAKQDIATVAGWKLAITVELGRVYLDARMFADAEQQLLKVLPAYPDDLQLLLLLGDSLHDQGRLEAALQQYEAAACVAPRSTAAHLNTGITLHGLGRYERALESFIKVLELDPAGLPAYSNIGTCLTYSPRHSPAQLKVLYDQMDRVIMQPLLDTRPFLNSRSPDRLLRVGYLSADFRQHPVAYFALPLLQGHQSGQVETCCYYTHPHTDEWTQRFRTAATLWRDCARLADAELAERIREDCIDILVDLSGHTLGHRLKLFARKPAPIQVSWMGYVTTTGLSAIDYRLTHVDVDPFGVDGEYSERLKRLPGSLWCYRPLPGMPEPATAPVLLNGYVTFGSLNRFSKVSDAVLACWCAILARVPESRLWLCIPEGRIRDEVAGKFAAAGVAAERLHYFGHLPHQEFWALHAQIDIALDPFPFNGGATTCETLWLGVPLISCSGGEGSFAPRFASRMGKAMLKAMGLEYLATSTEAGYIEKAVWLASQPGLLAELRVKLRRRMQDSALLDESSFVCDVEAAYRSMWRDWLSTP
jgi:protein O-GlcNAc transferase